MPHRPQRSWRSYFRKRGLTLPGYNYLGPFNSLDNGVPTNQSDRAAQKHDHGYKSLQDEGINPYITYNDADEQFIKEVGTDYGGRIGSAVFRAKRKASEWGLLPVHRRAKKPKIAGEPSLSNKPATTNTMPDGPVVGSGNNAGLKETPVDDVNPYEVYRGPPDYTFASLPFYYDALCSDITPVFTRDICFRMTSPYDPLNTVANTDLNTNVTGMMNVITPVPDSSDTTIRSANWWDYYSGMYTYYHTMGCRYTITIENYGEPLWVYFMYFNDEVPPGAATNLDLQSWRNVEYHYVNSEYRGIVDQGVRAVSWMGKSDNLVTLNENDEDMIPSGDNPNVNDLYNGGNNIQSKHGSSMLVKKGEYKTGQFRREIRLDSQVENWTLCNANPLLPEKLLIRVKPQGNVIEENSVRSAGDKLHFRIRVQLHYLVEFKELKYELRYPVVNQPLTVTLDADQDPRP